jgi:nucleoside-diphosphate-sugar epimerase
MRIIVTGGNGNVATGVVRRLIEHGHRVKVIDLGDQNQTGSSDYAQCDITSFPALYEQVQGWEAIIHLAAIPDPSGGPGHEIFRINCNGAYNVYEAAAQAGIHRVVSASSINALGYNFGIKSFPIRYFPIDEDHPTFTTDPYSFSKQVLEEIAGYFWRREGISGACLRMPWVYQTTDEMLKMIQTYHPQFSQAFHTLLSMPDAERRARVQGLIDRFEQLRAARLNEKPDRENARLAPEDQDPLMMVTFGHTDFWTILSVEDAAQAFEKAVLADYEGSHPLFVNESQNFTGIDSETLAGLFFPGVKQRKRSITDTQCLVSYQRAHELFGFEPEHSFIQRMGLN